MPAVPQIPKVAFFTLDAGGGAEDFSLDVTGVRVVPSPGAVQTVRTLDGTTHQDAESESWALELTCVVDWDSSRPGLAYYLFDHKGEEADFVYNASADASTGSATLPPIAGTCKLVPIQYGGAGNAFAEATVLLPITGDPVPDITP